AVNEANEVLSNPETRARYDRYGEHWKNAEAFEEQARNRQAQREQNYSSAPEDDFFRSVFGGSGGFDFGSFRQGRAGGKFKGQDIHATLKLLLTDVLTE